MNLTLLSPTHRKVMEVSWVEIQTTTGNQVILPGHERLIAELAKASSISYGLHGDVVNTIAITHGVASVDRHQVTILIDE